MGRLEGRVALVTGAARGIGLAIAARFALEGARVVVADIEAAAGRAAAGRLGTRFVAADVSDPIDVGRLFEAVAAEDGGLDLLVNNAGVSPAASILDTSPEEFDRVVRVNLRSVFLTTKAAVPQMRGRGGGVIINLASVNGLVAAPGLAVYSATKAAIINFTQATALEHAADRIRAVAICPASVDTPLLQAKFDATPDPAAARAANIARHPLGHIAAPEDVAALALFLASDEARLITGSAHLVDGGAAGRRV